MQDIDLSMIPQMNESDLGIMVQGRAPPIQPINAGPTREDQIKEYLSKIMNQAQQDMPKSNDMLAQILSQTMNPSPQDVSTSLYKTAQSYMAPNLYKPSTPEEAAFARLEAQFKPYSELAGAQYKSMLADQGPGGATGALVRQYMQSTGKSFADALYDVQTGMRQGLQRDQYGNVIPISGVPEARGAIKAGEKRGEKGVELAMGPQIAYEEAKARTTGETEVKTEPGKKQLGTTVDTMRGLYDELKQAGAAISTTQSYKENIGARIRGSDVGQFFGKAAGTKEQDIRNRINMQIPSLINDIRQATGMSARAMDSNTELQFYLKMATDPTSNVEANMEALNTIERKYLSGKYKEIPETPKKTIKFGDLP